MANYLEMLKETVNRLPEQEEIESVIKLKAYPGLSEEEWVATTAGINLSWPEPFKQFYQTMNGVWFEVEWEDEAEVMFVIRPWLSTGVGRK